MFKDCVYREASVVARITLSPHVATCIIDRISVEPLIRASAVASQRISRLRSFANLILGSQLDFRPQRSPRLNDQA